MVQFGVMAMIWKELLELPRRDRPTARQVDRVEKAQKGSLLIRCKRSCHFSWYQCTQEKFG